MLYFKTGGIVVLYFYLANATITSWSVHLPLKSFLWKTTLNAKINNWGIKSSVVDTLSRLIGLELTEPNLPEKEGNDYGYAMSEHLPDIYDDRSTCEPAYSVDVSNVNATIMKEEMMKTKKLNFHSVKEYYVEVGK